MEVGRVWVALLGSSMARERERESEENSREGEGSENVHRKEKERERVAVGERAEGGRKGRRCEWNAEPSGATLPLVRPSDRASRLREINNKTGQPDISGTTAPSVDMTVRAHNLIL